MILRKIKIENIRSYENEEIIFPKGSLLLSGDIGSGKTSILLAIEFALFGLQPGQKGSSLLKNGKDSGFVELEFDVGDNNVIINRTLKRKKTISQEDAFITINGITNERAVTELKNDVLSLLNYPMEFAKKTNLLYRFTVYTPQEEMKTIILETPEIRLNTLRHVFGIDKYKRIKENLSILTAKLRETIRLKQGELMDLESKKEILSSKKEQIISITSLLPNLETQIASLISLRDEKQKSIDGIKLSIDEKKRLENEIEKTNIFLIGKKEQLSRTIKDISDIKNRIQEAISEFSQKDLDEATKKLNEKNLIKEELNREIISYFTNITSLSAKQKELLIVKDKIAVLIKCPTCMQDVKDSHKQEILNQTQNEINTLKNQQISLDALKQKKEMILDSLKSEIASIEKEKNSLEILKIRAMTIKEDSKKLVNLEKNQQSLISDISLLENQIFVLKESVGEYKKFETVILAKEKELAEIILKEREIEIKKAQIVKEIQLLNIEVDNMGNEIIQKEKIKEHLIYITQLENWLSSDFLELISFIEKNVMLRLREQFSKLFNEWFSILVPDTFIVRLDQEFTPIIEQQDYEIDYSYLSGGERTAIALAYRLALNQTINSFLSEIKTKGIVILDEPTDGFSQAQLDKMRDVLKELNFDQLIIVSHDPKIESFVDNIIKLKKHEGISNIG